MRERFCQRNRVFNWNREPGFTITHDLAATGRIGCDERPATGCRFQKADGKALTVRGQYRDVAGAPEGCNIADMSEPRESGSLVPLLHFVERDRGRVYRIGVSRDRQVVVVALAAEDLVGRYKRPDTLIGQ